MADLTENELDDIALELAERKVRGDNYAMAMPQEEVVAMVIELRRRRYDIPLVLRGLRHMYQQMVTGSVRPAQEDIARIANGILAPAIERLERGNK